MLHKVNNGIKSYLFSPQVVNYERMDELSISSSLQRDNGPQKRHLICKNNALIIHRHALCEDSAEPEVTQKSKCTCTVHKITVTITLNKLAPYGTGGRLLLIANFKFT